MKPLLTIMTLSVLLAACWARFPDSRFNQDAATPEPDAGPETDTTTTPTCNAGEFIRCLTSGFARCNASGTGEEQIDCGEASCDAQAGRCDACTPGESACDEAGAALRQCSEDGLFEPTTCPAGCADGACCPDGDEDGDGCTDCDDENADIFTGQPEFFDQAIAGASFDYDCSGSDEPEFPDLVSCTGQGANCAGDGWVDVVPACGESGSFAVCQKKAGGCAEQSPKDKTQRCH